MHSRSAEIGWAGRSFCGGVFRLRILGGRSESGRAWYLSLAESSREEFIAFDLPRVTQIEPDAGGWEAVGSLKAKFCSEPNILGLAGGTCFKH